MRYVILFPVVMLVCAAQGQLVFDAYNTPVAQSRYFVANQGQFLDSDGDPMPAVKYMSYGNEPWIAMEADSKVSLAFNATVDTAQPMMGRIGWYPIGELAAQRVPYKYKNGLGVNNYLYPHLPDGVYGVKRHVSVRYENIFPKVDWIFYSTTDGIRCAFFCRPGFDPQVLSFGFVGQDSLGIDLQGALRMYGGGRHIRLEEAIAYQLDVDSNVVAVPWTATWDLHEWQATVRLQLGDFDPENTLILQVGPPPMGGGGGGGQSEGLNWSTLLGSGEPTFNNGLFSFGNAAVSTPDGDLIATGNTDHIQFPAVFGTTQAPFAGETDIWYGRFNYAPGNSAADAVNLYTTFVGGSEVDRPQAALRTSNDRYYIAGWTKSQDLQSIPTVNPNDGSYYQSVLHGLNDGFILRLEPSDGEIARLTYLGGDGEEMITAITEDISGNLVFAGSTTSDGAYSGTCNSAVSGFPLCDPLGNNYQQDSIAGGVDAFLFRVDSTFHLNWSTLYGGPGNDRLYDAASTRVVGGDPTKQLVVLVGCTDADMPDGENGAWHQDGNDQPNGWIATFRSDGMQKWSTNLHGLLQLEAVTASGDNIIVAGPTDYTTNAQVGCQPVDGQVSICMAAFPNAYVDSVNTAWDEYYAQFDADPGSLLWSTLYGEIGAETANDADTLFLQQYECDPFRIDRFSDVVLDAEGNLYAMGVHDAAGTGLYDPYPTLPAWGLYNRPWIDSTGVNQTDVTLKIFAPDRSLAWCSMFGAYFITNTGDPNFDYYNAFFGCDFGHQLVLVEEECMYLVGTSGGAWYDDECPYPGTSWCEPAYPFFSGPDLLHGFIARMNLQGISIGLVERTGTSNGLFVYPNPATDQLFLRHTQGSLQNCHVRIHDPNGRLVRDCSLQRQGLLDISALSAGFFHGSVIGPVGEVVGSFRFIKQ